MGQTNGGTLRVGRATTLERMRQLSVVTNQCQGHEHQQVVWLGRVRRDGHPSGGDVDVVDSEWTKPASRCA